MTYVGLLLLDPRSGFQEVLDPKLDNDKVSAYQTIEHVKFITDLFDRLVVEDMSKQLCHPLLICLRLVPDATR